jgi:metal-responsive CopG/Arc/MetJ family transcriptional regulator
MGENVNTYLDEERVEEVESWAEELGVSRSQMMSELVRDGLRWREMSVSMAETQAKLDVLLEALATEEDGAERVEEYLDTLEASGVIAEPVIGNGVSGIGLTDEAADSE